MRRIVFFGMFAVAIWALAELWALAGPVWEQRSGGPWPAALGYAALLVGSFLYLGFLLYEADRAAGRVKRPIALYDRWIAAKQRRINKGSGDSRRLTREA
ncbi:MAG: hypothetical protein HY660_17020 [Armatimonadetes bacterium]|nr:hypothetical protein [Armatimonadota bacterium]